MLNYFNNTFKSIEMVKKIHISFFFKKNGKLIKYSASQKKKENTKISNLFLENVSFPTSYPY